MNGVIHLVDDVLTTDASYNVTMIEAAEKLMGFGPFNDSQVGSTPPLSVTRTQHEESSALFASGRRVNESGSLSMFKCFRVSDLYQGQDN